MGRIRNNKKHLPEIQCKYCMNVLQGEVRYARHNLVMPMGMDVSTRTISHTRGLEPEIRKRVVEKVSKGQYGAAQVDTVSKVIRILNI